jgi:hypothetical protein
MKADLTRDTFDAKKHFRQVLAQQGRVQLDAELNEQGALGARRDETTTTDIAGHCGGPADAAAFRMSAIAGQPGDFLLSAGRYYVDGIQCELEAPVSYRQQPDLPGLAALPAGSHLVYLDVWQRHLTFLDDRRLLETALGGVDTTTRVKNIWQVRTVPVSGAPDCGGAYAEFTARTQASTIHLQARTQPVAGADDPCQMAEASGYTSLENQLYRVEIHSLQTAAEQARGVGRAAVWKWSRENGSVEVGLKAVNGRVLTVSSLGRDDKLGIRKGHFVELTDDAIELSGRHGDLLEVDDVDEGDLTITLKGPPEPAPAILTTVNPALHPRVRRWEGTASVQTNAWLDLEAGIQVKFANVNLARPGDYWQVPARTSAPGAQAGTIEWPQTVPGTADALLPRGIQHHYCRLGFDAVSGGAPVFTDCRCLWPTLTGVPRLFYLSGDGQEVMPAAAYNKLPHPLIAGIANAHCAAGARTVRFTVLAPDGNPAVAPSGGRLGAEGGALAPVATPVDIPINAAGEARCEFHLERTHYSQQVRAELLDAAGQAVRPAIYYNASLSVAREVAYDSECKGMDGANTVQKAITLLAGAIHLSAVGGDGQDGALDQVLPLPLRVAVTSACGPVEKQTVVFRDSRVDEKSPLGKLSSGRFSKTAAGPYVNELPVTTVADGFAECFWKLPAHRSSDVFEAIAELKDANKLTLEGPAAVRFTANLRTSAADEDPGAVHVIGMRIFPNSENEQSLANGDSLPPVFLNGGIAVDLDGPLTASTVATLHETGKVSGPGVPSNPSCFLICELPWPLLASERADVKALLPNAKPAILGFRPFIVRCETTFVKAGSKEAGSKGPDLVWIKPEATSVQFLNALFPLMQKAEIPERLLMRLTLKGNFIWRETTPTQLKDKGPAGWLDGDAWMVSHAQHPSALQGLIDQKLASGDRRRRGGDFEMWFWLVLRSGTEPHFVGPLSEFSAVP